MYFSDAPVAEEPSTIELPSVFKGEKSTDLNTAFSVDSPDPSASAEYSTTPMQRSVSPTVYRNRLSWRSPTDGRFFPFKSRPPTSFNLSQSNLRRSKRVRPPVVKNTRFRIVNRLEFDDYGFPYDHPIGLELLPTEEEVKRRRRFLARSRRGSLGADERRILAQRLACRLQILARRYDRSTNPRDSHQAAAPQIQLDRDVHWAPEDCFHLPIDSTESSMEERVIYPIDEVPPLLGFSQARPSSFTVPSYAGVWPTRSQPKRVPQLEVDVNLTRIVSKEQERRQLHFDAHSVNLFFFLGSHSAAAAEPSPWAVQLANRTFRLSQPSCVLVPKGIPYKFINASSTDLHLSRVIFS